MDQFAYNFIIELLNRDINQTKRNLERFKAALSPGDLSADNPANQRNIRMTRAYVDRINTGELSIKALDNTIESLENYHSEYMNRID